MAPSHVPVGLCAAVREHCAAIAHSARWVRIDRDAEIEAGGVAGLDAGLHFLDAPPEEVARYVLVLDAINFGSGWFGTLRLPAGSSGTEALTRALTEHARARGGTWTPTELRALDAVAVAEVLGQDPEHELMGLYAEGLRALGAFLGSAGALDVIAEAGGSAQRLAELLAHGMPFFDDVGFYKRAQITANDLVLAGVAAFADVDLLTAFADNLVPHVLRHSGVLEYAPALAERVDAGEPLPAGSPMEREIRGCAVHTCELLSDRLGVPPRVLDNWLWNRGEHPPFTELPSHVTRTVFY
jgi:hypothetical protein